MALSPVREWTWKAQARRPGGGSLLANGSTRWPSAGPKKDARPARLGLRQDFLDDSIQGSFVLLANRLRTWPRQPLGDFEPRHAVLRQSRICRSRADSRAKVRSSNSRRAITLLTDSPSVHSSGMSTFSSPAFFRTSRRCACQNRASWATRAGPWSSATRRDPPASRSACPGREVKHEPQDHRLENIALAHDLPQTLVQQMEPHLPADRVAVGVQQLLHRLGFASLGAFRPTVRTSPSPSEGPSGTRALVRPPRPRPPARLPMILHGGGAADNPGRGSEASGTITARRAADRVPFANRICSTPRTTRPCR